MGKAPRLRLRKRKDWMRDDVDEIHRLTNLVRALEQRERSGMFTAPTTNAAYATALTRHHSRCVCCVRPWTVEVRLDRTCRVCCALCVSTKAQHHEPRCDLRALFERHNVLTEPADRVSLARLQTRWFSGVPNAGHFNHRAGAPNAGPFGCGVRIGEAPHPGPTSPRICYICECWDLSAPFIQRVFRCATCGARYGACKDCIDQHAPHWHELINSQFCRRCDTDEALYVELRVVHDVNVSPALPADYSPAETTAGPAVQAIDSPAEAVAAASPAQSATRTPSSANSVEGGATTPSVAITSDTDADDPSGTDEMDAVPNSRSPHQSSMSISPASSGGASAASHDNAASATAAFPSTSTRRGGAALCSPSSRSDGSAAIGATRSPPADLCHICMWQSIMERSPARRHFRCSLCSAVYSSCEFCINELSSGPSKPLDEFVCTVCLDHRQEWIELPHPRTNHTGSDPTLIVEPPAVLPPPPPPPPFHPPFYPPFADDASMARRRQFLDEKTTTTNNAGQ